jgi:hypothetical protein
MIDLLVTLAIVALAVLGLAWHVRQSTRGKPGVCGGCSGCVQKTSDHCPALEEVCHLTPNRTSR